MKMNKYKITIVDGKERRQFESTRLTFAEAARDAHLFRVSCSLESEIESIEKEKVIENDDL